MDCNGFYINDCSKIDLCEGGFTVKAKNGKWCFIDYKKDYKKEALRYAKAFLRANKRMKNEQKN